MKVRSTITLDSSFGLGHTHRPMAEPSLTDALTPPDVDARSLHLLFEAVLAPRSATYVSVPITGGRRALDARRAEGGAAGSTAAVVAANLADARALVAAVRARTSRPVVDPAAVGVVAGWTQADYREFWGNTILRYAAEVVFADGFECSDGCAYEFAIAVGAGLPVFDARGATLSCADGVRLLENGRLARRGAGAPTDVVDDALTRLRSAR
jgi:hypothetical protein